MRIEELGLDINPSRGRPPRDLGPVAVVRELGAEDLALLQMERGVTPRPLIQRITERHHSLARCLASGMKNWEAAIVTGYTKEYIGIMKGDPTFKDLIHFYSQHVDAQYADLHKRLAGIAVDAADLLRDRMEEEPDKISTGQLVELTKMGADRTGHGPASTSTQLNIHVNMADRLKAARERVAQAKVIEGMAVDIEGGSADDGPALAGAVDVTVLSKVQGE